MEFIPAAEANGMIIEIGKFVLREACRNAAVWRAEPRRLLAERQPVGAPAQ